jgi:hypothetical protein
MFDDRAPRRALWVIVALSVVLVCSVLWAATHRRVSSGAVLEPCAVVVTADGSVCR